MPLATIADLTTALNSLPLLTSEQKAQLPPLLAQFTDPKSLAKELVQRGWLTPFQINRILGGKSADLVLGTYLLLDRLGEGGMGAVYKARHVKMNRLVALKVIRNELLANPDAIKRFEREVQAAAQLSHVNIVTAYDAAQVGQTHFFAMEYVEGTDLNKLVGQRGPLPIEQASDCIRQAALGLQHAHEQGLVHRDIKPHNLLLTTKGVVKILDMGLARLRQSADGTAVSKGLTQEGACMGTPSYMAPEQALDSHKADIRADVYSLGCTFYFLLTGQPPFEGATTAEVLIKHQMAEAEPVETRRPEVPAPLAVVLRRMMAKKPEERFQTPGEAALALAALGGSGMAAITRSLPPTEVRAGTAAHQGATLAPGQDRTMLGRAMRGKDRRWLMASAAVLVVAFIGVLALALGGKGDRPVAATTEPAKEPAKPLSEEEAWRLAVARMKPEDQVKAVEVRLKKLNPNFKGKVEPEQESSGVVKIVLVSGEMTDISPVRGFPKLQSLAYGGDAGFYSGKLTDLSPLRGMSLKKLHIANCRVANLSPLEGMPLTELNIMATHVTDLRPLKGMKLTALHCNFTGIMDFSPLQGSPLENLSCRCESLTDLKSLKGLPLKYLDITNSCVSDLSPISGSPIVNLLMDGTQVKDLSPLKGKKLEHLECNGSPVSNLAPLEGQPLRELHCNQTRVADLSPLHDMPLTSLGIGFTQVKTLSQLKGLNLTKLSCNNLPVSDFSPLKEMKLTYLDYRGTEVADVSPLRFLPLQEILCDFKYDRDEPILRKITTLQTINGKTAAEFWKEQDAANKKP